MLHNNENLGTEKQACDSRVSRKEFLTTLVRRATLAGAILAAPKVVDKFLVPPALAVTSTSQFSDTGGVTDTNTHSDVTNHNADSLKNQNRGDSHNDFG